MKINPYYLTLNNYITMNKEQFTPGPWAITRGAGNDKMFFIESRPERGQYWQQIFEGEIYNGEANANLIAAAPDMYEALKKLQDQFVTALRINGEPVLSSAMLETITVDFVAALNKANPTKE